MTDNDRKWIRGEFTELRKEIVKNQVSLARLEVKGGIVSGLFGIVGGAISVAVIMGMSFIKGRGE